ncbi:IBR domain-containing protein [Colletotrichum cuscutae]|uniref:IBR domain-containing protein n=1 Tax=Colletotrichum cuscutae TaxID=1209917 RepID=A0AAI9Y0Z1_9PEZI|nr:IBR domain-containing protein [Colletotrichum cuscutae]
MDLFQRLDEDITNIIIEHGFLNLDTLRFATEREVERAAVRALEMATPDQQLAIAMRQSVMGIEGDDAIIHENENEANDNDANDNAGNVVMEGTGGYIGWEERNRLLTDTRNNSAETSDAEDDNDINNNDRTECVVCFTARQPLHRLPCGCRMCPRCLRRCLRAGLRPGGWPPRCCQPLQPENVEQAAGEGRPRLEETPGGERVYCARPECAAFIPAAGDVSAAEDAALMDVMDELGFSPCPSCRRIIELFVPPPFFPFFSSYPGKQSAYAAKREAGSEDDVSAGSTWGRCTLLSLLLRRRLNRLRFNRKFNRKLNPFRKQILMVCGYRFLQVSDSSVTPRGTRNFNLGSAYGFLDRRQPYQFSLTAAFTPEFPSRKNTIHRSAQRIRHGPGSSYSTGPGTTAETPRYAENTTFLSLPSSTWTNSHNLAGNPRTPTTSPRASRREGGSTAGLARIRDPRRGPPVEDMNNRVQPPACTLCRSRAYAVYFRMHNSVRFGLTWAQAVRPAGTRRVYPFPDQFDVGVGFDRRLGEDDADGLLLDVSGERGKRQRLVRIGIDQKAKTGEMQLDSIEARRIEVKHCVITFLNLQNIERKERNGPTTPANSRFPLEPTCDSASCNTTTPLSQH